MYYPAEIVIRNYKPLHLEKDMLFINKIYHGSYKELIEIWALDKVPQDEEKFIQENGYPVELAVIDYDQDLLAEHHEIALFDEGDHTDELRDITIADLNIIFQEFDGGVEIEIDEETMDPVFIEGNVVLRLPIDEEYEEEEEE